METKTETEIMMPSILNILIWIQTLESYQFLRWDNLLVGSVWNRIEDEKVKCLDSCAKYRSNYS